MTINDSAAEFENASRVAFRISELIYKKVSYDDIATYKFLVFNFVNRRVDVVLSRQRDAKEGVHDSCQKLVYRKQGTYLRGRL